jgi:hypothetical protein
VGVLHRIGRPGKALLLLAVGAAGGGAALAVASVPNPSGVIHACYAVQTINGAAGLTVVPAQTAALRVIDPSAGQHCNTVASAAPQEATLDFNQQGPPGVTGRQGLPGTRGPPGPVGSLTITSPPANSSEAPIGHAVLNTPGSPVLTVAVFRIGSTGLPVLKSPGRNKYEPITLQRGYVNDSAFSDWVNHVRFSDAIIKLDPGGRHLKIRLSDAVISAYSLAPAPGGNGKLESITLSYKAITINP